jgi:hypothetical protein
MSIVVIKTERGKMGGEDEEGGGGGQLPAVGGGAAVGTAVGCAVRDAEGTEGEKRTSSEHGRQSKSVDNTPGARH